ncbi:Carboxypeptidase [Nesidiocoris tenuis]|uniref:Carboxypeptidase n=2 Tax=Nesidiocoris tenuis TaxID=355587 RepID=A0ABN7AEW5_9HEMI|nr:Carboxypeptidase [Nesidiocoris tenuis]
MTGCIVCELVLLLLTLVSHSDASASKKLCGNPLFLTPLIERGEVEKARECAGVPSMIKGEGVTSYAGFFTVNGTYNSNLYFWFFPSETDERNAPVAIWLQGGPGGSSLFALFKENGPLVITSTLEVKKRKYYWSKNINLIYFDNPVGTGFSFTDNDAGYATNEEDVARNLYAALRQFFIVFPEYQKNEFYITGESYAGKYIPALGHKIHAENPRSEIKINLVGLAIGDGWVDPVHMMVYSKYLYQHGLIDTATAAKMRRIEKKTVQLIKRGKFHAANQHWNRILGTMLSNQAGPIDVYDFLKLGSDNWPDKISLEFFNRSSVREDVHVGNLTFHAGNKVYAKLFNDMPKSVAPWLVEMMENYRVLLYSGELDIIVAYPLTTNFVKQLQWSGSKDYGSAKRKLWFVDNELAGYSTNVGNFTQLLVRNAGHMVPWQQPRWAWDMITRFTRNVPFSSSGLKRTEDHLPNSGVRLP